AEIYYHIGEFLGESTHPYTRARYALKQAIMDLGPTGYPFEDFLAGLMKEMGYTTNIRTVVSGRCVTHEIDVIAEKHTVMPNKIMVEAKFHNQVGIHTNIHVALYTKARFDDVKDKNKFTEAWLVTNTKASTDAIAYANCVRMNLVSWSYPEGDSLRDWVERYHMYPITVLTTLSPTQKQQLFEKGIVLCRDICQKHAVLQTLNLPTHKMEDIIKEVEFVCDTHPKS
ncbi:MAG: restriction endonuclease, partial [Patescibacteria group bacterium]|nr:restriction endonuclease [Patescibacteria group bacterium]